MPRQEFDITTDLDGVQFKAPFPMATFLSLLAGKFEPPSQVTKVQMVDPTERNLKTKLETAFHRVRPIKKSGRESLRTIKAWAEEVGQPLTIRAVSGRPPALHQMTRERLAAAGYDDLLDSVSLNQSTSSSGWKAWEIGQGRKLKPDSLVIHIEDDLKAALRVAQVDPEGVLVFLLKNPSNHPWLLKRNGIVLPDNVILVNNFAEITDQIGLLMFINTLQQAAST